MINEEYISQIVNQCSLSNFQADEKGIIRTDGLPEYVDKIIENTLSNLVENSELLIKDKCLYEIQQSISDFEIQKLALIFRISEAVYNYLIRKYFKKSPENDVFSYLVISAIKQYKSILSENLSGEYISIIAQVRILYENYISYMYIRKYPSLAGPFKDHADIIKIKMQKELGSNFTEEENKNYGSLLEKYGKEFLDDYGWTKDIIKERKKRMLITMVKDVGLTDYKALYKISSNFIHPSSFSVFYSDTIQSGILTEFNATSVELMSNHIIHFMEDIKCKEKDRILLMNLIYGLREELFNEPKTTE